jgi:hypothetical protein
MKNVKVRVVKQHGPLARYPIGFEMEPGGGVADLWLRYGWVELVEDEAAVECAVIAPERNAAIRTEAPKKRKRGRPRKHPLPT